MTKTGVCQDQIEAWQTLLASEAGRPKLARLGEQIRTGMTRRELLASPAFSQIEAQRAAAADMRALTAALAEGTRVVLPEDYSPQLAHVPEPPVALFVNGDWSAAKARTIGIVGTRGATTYGKAVAQKFAEAFVKAGVTVVSGGALGIDAAAHKGALQAGGKTIAALAGGVDKVYPAVHGALFRGIAQSGCLVSQFAVGARPNAYKFLVRNHLVAGLSEALVLIEVPERSGALVTGSATAELGREVFVVPANIDNLNFAGSHALIRDGATLVYHPDQVLEALGIVSQSKPQPKLLVGETAEQILAVLTVEPLSPEKIVEATGFDHATVLSELTLLELEGAVIRDAGGYAITP